MSELIGRIRNIGGTLYVYLPHTELRRTKLELKHGDFVLVRIKKVGKGEK